MKTKLTRVLCADSLAAVAAIVPAAAQTTPASEGRTHAPMKPYRNPDGSIYRFHNTIVSSFWSGYAVTASPPYSSASATWQVPSVSYDGVSNPPAGEEAAVNWVGIGGDGDSTLIQLGTGETAFTTGATSYGAWYELYPAGAVGISNPVKPGDIITVSLQCTAACSPSSVQTWQLTMTDATAGWTWTQSFQYQSSMASAEWIVETPEVGSGFVPLPDYAQATFDPVEANGQNPNLSLSANGIIMQSAYGESSNPSSPVNGDSFSTCWGAIGAALTPRTAGSFTTPPAPTTASLSANPRSISLGQSTLTWSSTDATSCTGSDFAASGTSGSAVVDPAVTTSYSVTCTGNGGSATAMATVTVSSPAPGTPPPSPPKSCHGRHCR